MQIVLNVACLKGIYFLNHLLKGKWIKNNFIYFVNIFVGRRHSKVGKSKTKITLNKDKRKD